MWKDKHVVTAMLVAPILAIMAWFGVDYMVTDRAEAAKPGASYALIAKSNCRYESGACDLANNDLKLRVRPVDLLPEQTRLALESDFELLQATLSLVHDGEEVVGVAVADDSPGTSAQLIVTIPAFADPAASLRVAVTVQQSIYFAEVPVVFMRPE